MIIWYFWFNRLDGLGLVEYLEDDTNNDSDAKNDADLLGQYEDLLPMIKESISERSDVQIDDDTKYKFTKKPNGLIEVQITMSDNKMLNIEMEDYVVCVCVYVYLSYSTIYIYNWKILFYLHTIIIATR